MSVQEYMRQRREVEKHSLFRIEDELTIHHMCAKEMVRIYKECNSRMVRSSSDGWYIRITAAEQIYVQFRTNDIFHDMFLDSQKHVVKWVHWMGRYYEHHSMETNITHVELFGGVIQEMHVLSLFRILKSVK